MKCPMCLGKGYATDEDIKEYPHRCPNCDGKGFYMVDWQKVRCEVCNGSGKKPMTEQEHLQSCTTEQLAEAILQQWIHGAYHGVGEFGLTDKEIELSREDIVEWLKQPHTVKE